MKYENGVLTDFSTSDIAAFSDKGEANKVFGTLVEAAEKEHEKQSECYLDDDEGFMRGRIIRGDGYYCKICLIRRRG